MSNILLWKVPLLAVCVLIAYVFLSLLAIQCNSATDTNTSTVVTLEGMYPGDTAMYKCNPGYQIVATGAIQYNITCTRTPNTYMATWSAHPDTEGQQM